MVRLQNIIQQVGFVLAIFLAVAAPRPAFAICEGLLEWAPFSFIGGMMGYRRLQCMLRSGSQVELPIRNRQYLEDLGFGPVSEMYNERSVHPSEIKPGPVLIPISPSNGVVRAREFNMVPPHARYQWFNDRYGMPADPRAYREPENPSVGAGKLLVESSLVHEDAPARKAEPGCVVRTMKRILSKSVSGKIGK